MIIDILEKKDDKWEVFWVLNEKHGCIAITDSYDEADAVFREASQALTLERFEQWLEEQKAIRYHGQMKKWYLAVRVYGKKYYLGHLESYAKAKKLYGDLQRFINTQIYREEDFVKIYGKFIEGYKVNRMILKVRNGDIFTDDGNDRVTITLNCYKKKYDFGQFDRVEARRFQGVLIKHLKQGLAAFHVWHNKYYFQMCIESNLFTLIGQKLNEETILHFARKYGKTSKVFYAGENAYVIYNGDDKVGLRFRVNPAGIICLSSIEYV